MKILQTVRQSTRAFIVAFIVAFSLAFSILPFTAVAENAPREIAGIALGSNIADYPDIIQTNFLKEVVVTDWHGFRKGVISYGTCKYTDLILKIDMKYQDTSKKFYQKLLQEFRKKFGEPDAWKGDSFGVVHIWKWQFIDKDKNPVSLSLQYNAKSTDETIGNMVKLSYPAKIVEERGCFMEMCQREKKNIDEQRRKVLKKFEWSHLIPR